MVSDGHMLLQVIQKVKELIPNIEINEFYQCEYQRSALGVYHFIPSSLCSQPLQDAGIPS